jgi:hypothetical protein
MGENGRAATVKQLGRAQRVYGELVSRGASAISDRRGKGKGLKARRMGRMKEKMAS